MKKLLITLISVFVFINFAFAQSTQQEINRLKKEQAKAEQAKKTADERLRTDPNDENYDAAKVASANLAKINIELIGILETQKAEQEARAKAQAQAEEDRLMALYQKRFPEFVFVDVEGEVKNYVLQELKKDPNWDIIDIQEIVENSHYIIKTTSGTAKIGYGHGALEIAMMFRRDQSRFYELRKELALPIMIEDFTGYYLRYAGIRNDSERGRFLRRRFSEKIDKLKCQTMVVSYKDISDNSCYYRKENTSDAYLNTFNKIKDNKIIFVNCIKGRDQFDLTKDIEDVYAYNGGNCGDKLVIQKQSPSIKKVDSKYFIPLQTQKTFKIQDYFDKTSYAVYEVKRREEKEKEAARRRPSSSGC